MSLTKRERERIQKKSSELLRSLVIAYVYHSFERSKEDKKKMFDIQNKKWKDECFNKNKSQRILNPLAFENMLKNKEAMSDIESVLGLKSDKKTWLQKIFSGKKLIHKGVPKMQNPPAPPKQEMKVA